MQGCGMPEVGYELQNEAGEIIAEAELAWVEEKLAILTADQEVGQGFFERLGWKVVRSHRNDTWSEAANTLLVEMTDE